MANFRSPTAAESALLEKLVQLSFQGSNELKAQLQSLQVREIDDDGSLELQSDFGPDAEVTDRVPVEGELIDRDGVCIHVLLHVVDGRMKELEVYKEDGSHISELDPERMTVSTLS